MLRRRIEGENGYVSITTSARADEFRERGYSYITEVYIDGGNNQIPFERSIYETEEEATEAFKRYCEKYRKKRNEKDKNGIVIKYLRGKGIDVKEKRNPYTGLRDGINVYYIDVYGRNLKFDFDANDYYCDPEGVTDQVYDYLVNILRADIEKGKAYYGLK